MTHIVSAVSIIMVAVIGMFMGVDVSYHGGAVVATFGDQTDGWWCINGMIFGAYDDHEYGHYLQQREIGDMAYYTTVAIPSFAGSCAIVAKALLIGPISMTEYHRLPWEADANRRAAEYKEAR